MELEFRKNRIVFSRVLSNLDKLVFKFVKVLEKQKVRYVIISGYVAILFGRSRNTEDVDLFIEEMPFKRFESLWFALEKEGFECIHVSSAKEAFEDFLQQKLAVRFAEKGFFEPNFELKFPKTDLNRYSLEHPLLVELPEGSLWSSELELQIAFKLYLGSEKDIEDAIHLWETFKKNLDTGLIERFAVRLGVKEKVGLLDGKEKKASED